MIPFFTGCPFSEELHGGAGHERGGDGNEQAVVDGTHGVCRPSRRRRTAVDEQEHEPHEQTQGGDLVKVELGERDEKVGEGGQLCR